MINEVTKEQIDDFFKGNDPMEKIVNIEGEYNSDKISVIYRDTNDVKKVKHEPFYPFCWAKVSVGKNLFNGDRELLKKKLYEYGIQCKGLRIHTTSGEIPGRLENGYKLLFTATKSMTYNTFMNFFREGGRPIYPKESDDNYGLKEYISISPVEQFMIKTGKRQFKGYSDYDDLVRLQFDLETEGLDPKICAISQIGIRTNKGYEKILTITGSNKEERILNEINAIKEFFLIIKELKPDVITGHNIENFDFWFIDERLKLFNSSLSDLTSGILPRRGIYKSKKQRVLKLGGEVEYYSPTIMWGTAIVDSLFAVRRAQAINSNIKKADLKYITKFAKLNKPNRVYVPGKIINETWCDTSKSYAHNDTDGEWFKITEKLKSKTFLTEGENITKERYSFFENKVYDNKLEKEYNITTGRYIVERYLLDDLYETDKVELSFNQNNFQTAKMLPVLYEKICTMGTAAIWKYIMLTWSYENGLAIPLADETRSFTGGLSRLLKTGYIDNVFKADYNSLYPSIILTHDINTNVDMMGAMTTMLEYVLTKREEYKTLKKVSDKKIREVTKNINELGETNELLNELNKAKKDFAFYDNMQAVVKVLGNSFFGSYGSGSVFFWSSIPNAEETTCTGRMALRLMIKFFSDRGYEPLVGDSFTYDTPIFIKYNLTDDIDIKPVNELFNDELFEVDALGREYDYSKKDYKILCRSGWLEPNYIYRHKADKDLYRVTSDKNVIVDVTEDHSLFNDKQEKIKPSKINNETEIEYSNIKVIGNIVHYSKEEIEKLINFNVKYTNKVSKQILNSEVEVQKLFVEKLKEKYKNITIENFSKTFVAGFQFLERNINELAKN